MKYSRAALRCVKNFLINGWLSFHALMINSRIYGDQDSPAFASLISASMKPRTKRYSNEQQMDVPRGKLRVVGKDIEDASKP